MDEAAMSFDAWRGSNLIQFLKFGAKSRLGGLAKDLEQKADALRFSERLVFGLLKKCCGPA